jgi:hypothetical protein
MAMTDIGSQRQSWFNSQALIARSNHLRVLQQRPEKHPLEESISILDPDKADDAWAREQGGAG